MSIKTVVGFKAASAIREGDILQFSAAGTLAPADGNGTGFCAAIDARLTGEPVDAVCLQAGVHELVAGAAVTAGQLVKIDASDPGRVEPITGTAGEQAIGQALEAASGAGDKIKVAVGPLSGVIVS